MKKLILTLATAILMMLPVISHATNWQTPDKGYFQCYSLPGSWYSNGKSVVSYNGKVYSFDYEYDIPPGTNNFIQVRELTNTDPSFLIKWSLSKNFPQPSIAVSKSNFQPAAVVFNGLLYLFVRDRDNQISYCSYDRTSNTWSALKKGPTNYADYMAASVFDGKLFLVVPVSSTNNSPRVLWTSDTLLTTWSSYDVSTVNHGVSIRGRVKGRTFAYYISSLVKSYHDADDTVRSQLLIGYIDLSLHACCVDLHWDSKNNTFVFAANKVISASQTYSSVALGEGTVMGDTSSHGHQVQAFLALSNYEGTNDNTRIQRYETTYSRSGSNDAGWILAENNLVPQKWMWACVGCTNLTVLNIPVMQTDPNLIKQFMCLFYDGYNDECMPFVETDHLLYVTKTTVTVTDTSQWSIFGYISGPPPFYLNDKVHYPPENAGSYIDENNRAISAVDFETSEASQDQYKLNAMLSVGFLREKGLDDKYDIGGYFQLKFGWTTTYTKAFSVEIVAGRPNTIRGTYLCSAPQVSCTQYAYSDVHGNSLPLSNYVISNEQPLISHFDGMLPAGLNPADPLTFYNRDSLWTGYPAMSSPGSSSWNNGVNTTQPTELKTQFEVSVTAGVDEKISRLFGHEKTAEMAKNGFRVDSKIEFSYTHVTTQGNTVLIPLHLRSPEDTSDCVRLDVEWHWIQPSSYRSNWWVPTYKGHKQSPWCLTYCTKAFWNMNRHIINPLSSADGGTGNTAGSSSANDSTHGVPVTGVNPNPGFSLAQNSPNPFTCLTTFRYNIGGNSIDGGGFQTRLTVSDLSGSIVATLANGIQAPGRHEVKWDASHLAPGLYYYTLRSGNFLKTRKLVLTR